MRDIAAEAGVSLSTVFRVLNSDVPVSPSVKAKVLAAKTDLENREFEKSRSMNGLSVGIIMPSDPFSDESDHPSIYSIISSFSKELAKRGITNGNIIFDGNEEISGIISDHGKSGYLVIGTSEEQEQLILSAISETGVPCFFVNRRTEASNAGSVGLDDETAAMEATEHLISKGHRTIAFVGGNRDFQNTERRLKGYEAALRKHGLEIREDLILFGRYSEPSGYEMGEQLLRSEIRPTAAFFASDPLALGCLRYMKENGVRIPDDMAMIGFGNAEASRYSEPTLSTVSQPDREIGAAAAAALVQMIENPVIRKMDVQLKTELIIREST